MEASDKTPSPPDCLKSPEPTHTRIPGSVVIERFESFDKETRRVGLVKEKVAKIKISGELILCQRPSSKMQVVRVMMTCQWLNY